MAAFRSVPFRLHPWGLSKADDDSNLWDIAIAGLLIEEQNFFKEGLETSLQFDKLEAYIEEA